MMFFCNIKSFQGMKSEKQFAVVTGASRGLGRCFALELARRGINTILISLPGEGLMNVAFECRFPGTESYIRETDITQKENVAELCGWINANFNVFLLINNAGTGGTRSFVDCPAEYLDTIIQLNIAATTMMTHQLLPNMLGQKKAYVLNVSSMASFSPVGYKTVYPASKRFIQHFSRGLYQELKNTSVFVSVVHPGGMKTNPDVTERIENQGFFARMVLQTPEYVARRSIRQLFRRDTLILPGWSSKFSWLLMALLPVWISMPLMSRVVSREIQPKTANNT